MTAHAHTTKHEVVTETVHTNTAKPNVVTENAIKLVGEAFIPGASLLMDGKILQGGAHVVVGALAKMALGPVGLALVIANSFSKSTTGKNLLKQFIGNNPTDKAHAEK